jgi:CDP-glucose 4,6-dehydratase
MGHEVYGYSLPAKPSSLFSLSEPEFEKKLSGNIKGDVTDFHSLKSSIISCRPDKIIHLAAQSLVIKSYEDPFDTLESNLSGTKNLLEVIRHIAPDIPLLIATTDKVYRNDGRHFGYKEHEELRGGDPYSLSKSLADLTSQYYMAYLGLTNTHIVRAGNVIGGGDVSENRLLPELITQALEGKSLTLRNPDSTRPWQYVLDCIQAYVSILESPQGLTAEKIWNIGPRNSSNVTVRELAEMVLAEIGKGSIISSSPVDRINWKESEFLALDSTRFRDVFSWNDRYSLAMAVQSTVDWHTKVKNGQDPYLVSETKIKEFLASE